MLGTLVLHTHDDSGRDVSYPNSAVCRVHVLTTGTRKKRKTKGIGKKNHKQMFINTQTGSHAMFRR